MKQFDICRNVGRTKSMVPYLLVLQSNWFNRSTRRVVVPLLANKPPASAYDPTAMPPITVGGATYYLDILGILNIPVDRLGEPMASARDDQDTVLRALDWLVHTGPSAVN